VPGGGVSHFSPQVKGVPAFKEDWDKEKDFSGAFGELQSAPLSPKRNPFGNPGRRSSRKRKSRGRPSKDNH